MDADPAQYLQSMLTYRSPSHADMMNVELRFAACQWHRPHTRHGNQVGDDF